VWGSICLPLQSTVLLLPYSPHVLPVPLPSPNVGLCWKLAECEPPLPPPHHHHTHHVTIKPFMHLCSAYANVFDVVFEQLGLGVVHQKDTGQAAPPASLL